MSKSVMNEASTIIPALLKPAKAKFQAKRSRLKPLSLLLSGALVLSPVSVPFVQAEVSTKNTAAQSAAPQAATTLANLDAASFDHKQAPNLLIEKTTNALLKALMDGSKLDKSLQDDHYRQAVESIVAPFIDFETMARRVMARNYKLAKPAQREAFYKVFRESLVDTYTKGISGYSDEELKVLPFNGTKKNRAGVERASVEMEIRTKEGDVIPVIYQVYRNEEGNWRLENMILSGVNLGLTFRNQFNEALRSAKGDIDKVIADWNIPSEEIKDQAKSKSK